MTPSSPDGPPADDPRPATGGPDSASAPTPPVRLSKEPGEEQLAGAPAAADAPAPGDAGDAAPADAPADAPVAVAEPAVPGQEATGVPVLPQEAPAAVPAEPPLAAAAPGQDAAHDDEAYDDEADDEADDAAYDDEPYHDEADDEAYGDADGPEPAAPALPAGTPPGRLRRALPVVAAALAVVLLAALVIGLGLRLREQRQLAQVQRPSGPALSAAREAGKVLFSYDYNHLDADFAAALALTTGSFTGEYRDFTEKVVKPVAVDNQVVVTATVSEAGATGRTTAHQLVALVFVDQTTRSSLLPDEAVDRSRVRMTLVQRGSAWKVSKVEAL